MIKMNESYMIKDIKQSIEEKFGVKGEVSYDYHPLSNIDVIDLITTHLEDGRFPSVSTGEGTVVKWGDTMTVTLLKRGVEIHFYDFYNNLSNQRKKEVKR